MIACAELEACWGRYRLRFRLRRAEVKRLRIAVHPDGQIMVVAPLQASDAAVCARVARRGAWIVRQRQQASLWRPRTPARQYLSGETHLWLGRQLRLRIILSDRQGVCVEGGHLIVHASRPCKREAVRTQVTDWYKLQARRLLHDRYLAQATLWQRQGIAQPRLIVRAMTHRWGSLTPAGILVLNADLVHASPRLIDYVIAHEMAHVLHPDHGSGWRRMMARVMPDWEQRKRALEKQLL